MKIHFHLFNVAAAVAIRYYEPSYLRRLSYTSGEEITKAEALADYEVSSEVKSKWLL